MTHDHKKTVAEQVRHRQDKPRDSRTEAKQKKICIAIVATSVLAPLPSVLYLHPAPLHSLFRGDLIRL